MGCLEIWDQICDVQGRFGSEFGRARGGGEVAVPLPEPKMDTLATVRNSMIIIGRGVSEQNMDGVGRDGGGIGAGRGILGALPWFGVVM